jgi:single-strand DNA-binding protein
MCEESGKKKSKQNRNNSKENSTMNSATIIGNLVADCRRELTSTDKKVAIARVAVNTRNETTYIDVKAWQGRAEFLANNFAKGSRVGIEGEMRMDSWKNKEGKPRSRLYILANNISFAGGKRTAAAASEPGPVTEPAVNETAYEGGGIFDGEEDGSDIPF